MRSARSYARLVRQTMKIGLTALTLRPACMPSPSVELLSGDGLSRIEVDPSDLVHGVPPGLHYGCAEVADCFHRMHLSGEIRRFSAGQGIEHVPQDEGNQNFAPPDSLADVLFAADEFFLEPLLRSVFKPSTTEPTAILATEC